MKQIFMTIWAMLSVAQSQKANDSQTVMGLFLLASGSGEARGEGFGSCGADDVVQRSVGLNILSEEAQAQYRQLIYECMHSVVRHNLNIPFTAIESERCNFHNRF
jgi:hypothetical protein